MVVRNVGDAEARNIRIDSRMFNARDEQEIEAFRSFIDTARDYWYAMSKIAGAQGNIFEDAKNWPAGGWYPEQRMTREEALKSMTIWPAYAAFQERDLGSLTAGKYADFVVLDRDIMTVDERDVPGAVVLATYIGGKAVYQRP